MAKPTDAQIEDQRAIIAEAREQALQAKADIIRVKARNKAENIRKKADGKAKMAIAKGEARAAKIEGITPAEWIPPSGNRRYAPERSGPNP